MLKSLKTMGLLLLLLVKNDYILLCLSLDVPFKFYIHIKIIIINIDFNGKMCFIY